MALKVIGAGLGRTGTLSLKLALDHIGMGPCYHMAEVLTDLPAKLPLWLDVVAGKPDWDAVFDGYAATVDYPGCHYWRDLLARWPDAKVILSVRNPESWFNSVHETIMSPHMRAMTDNSPARAFFENTVYADFGDRIEDKDFMVDYFEKWSASVVAAVPPEQLLVFEAKQGWEPLCAFLGVPVPDAPYPRVNSRDEMQGMMLKQGAAPAPQSPPPSGPPTLEMIGAIAKVRLAEAKAAAFGAKVD